MGGRSISLRCFDLTRLLATRHQETGGKNMMAQDMLLNVKQVAEYLQLKESTIYSWAQDGKIPAIKIGRTWRFRRTDLDDWLERHLRGEAEEQVA